MIPFCYTWLLFRFILFSAFSNRHVYVDKSLQEANNRMKFLLTFQFMICISKESLDLHADCV